MKARRVGLIVPQGAEFDFIRESLPFSGGEKVDGAQYHHFTIPGTGVTGILRVLSDMGQAPATLTADRMISRLNLSLVVLIGTAAALDPGIRLGDVVVADQIQEYLRKARVIPEAGGKDFAFHRAAESWRTNHRLLEHVNNWGWMADGEPAIAAWRRSAAARRPVGSGAPGQPGDPPREPDVRVGPVATGDLVVAAQAFTDWIRAANRKLVALDMEAGGAALAAYHNDQADMLVVRGVSDYADDRKSALDAGQDAAGVKDAWRRYAVRNAIEYLAILLSSAGFPWREQPSAGPSAAAVLGGVAVGAAGASLLHGHHDIHSHDTDLDPRHDQHHHKDGQHDPHHGGHQSADLAAAAVELAMLSHEILELERELGQQHPDDHGDHHDFDDHHDFGDNGEHF